MASASQSSHEALFLPVDEDSLLFQICFYYGLIVVFVEVVVPLLFQRRLRLHLPLNVLPQAPPVLSDDAFQQQRTQLGVKLKELQRASSAAKKKKLLLRRKLLGLSDEKKTPRDESAARRGRFNDEREADMNPPSGLRPPSLTNLVQKSTGKSTKSTSSSGVRTREARSSRRRDAGVAGADLPPSKLQQPSRSYFASSAATENAERATASAPSSGERRPSEKRRLSVGGSAKASLISDTQQRQAQREMRRYSWQKDSEAEVDADDLSASKLPQASFSYTSSLRREDDEAAPARFESEPLARNQRMQESSKAFGLEVDPQHELQDEELIDFYPVEPSPSQAAQRSIGHFAQSQQSIFDDSDEEFLTVIRRPRSPVAMGPSRTFTSFGNEQMDVERTINAAFGGRPLGGGAAAPIHYQPVALAPALSVPAAASYHQANMYEQHQAQAQALAQQQQQQQQQQRNQFITSRRESPDARNYHQEEAVGATNYREVARDRTPKIIRKIAFDEEMMALAATPNPDAAAGEKRKRSMVFSPEDEAQDFSRRRTRL